MKVIIAYPPLSNQKGTPLLSQNRQFQYFKEETFIYPVVPALGATLLKQSGYQVIWLDCIARAWSYGQFLDFIQKEKPELIAFETKTPVVKQHWKIINELKTQNSQLKTVLFGDHVTALPEESFQNSRVDFVLTGGDYDFLLLNLCNVLSKTKTQDPRPKTQDLEPGIYYRENGQINPSTTVEVNGESFDSAQDDSPKDGELVEPRSRTIKNTGPFQLNHKLDSLPFIDRNLTQWQLYAYKNGNYRSTPGTYIMSGRDCWHRDGGGCTFCSWPQLYPEFRVRKYENVLDEIEYLIENYPMKEIMDDTGTLPCGDWLRGFCNGMIKRGLHKRVTLDCNMRFGAVDFAGYKLMQEAGFRLLLFGLESANQKTLERINKNSKVETIIRSCQEASKAGLCPHITIMFGYPWEDYDDALKTFRLGSWLLKKGYAYTMQATIVIPYPGTSLFEECRRNGQLRSLDWNDYDMKKTVMRTSIPDDKIMELVQRMYNISFQPEFILRKVLSVRCVDDLKYSFRAAKKVLGHIFDFRHKEECSV